MLLFAGHVMKAVRDRARAKTAPDVLTTAVAVARRIAKVPRCRVCDGFVGKPDAGAARQAGDNAVRGPALPSKSTPSSPNSAADGPFADGDLAGSRMAAIAPDRASSRRSPTRWFEAGRFGQKTGKELKYEAGSRAALARSGSSRGYRRSCSDGAQRRPSRRRDSRAHDVSDDQRRRAILEEGSPHARATST